MLIANAQSPVALVVGQSGQPIHAVLKAAPALAILAFSGLLGSTGSTLAQESRAGMGGLLHSYEAAACRQHPTVHCLTDLAMAASRYTAMPWQIARPLAGAGRFADAYTAVEHDPRIRAEKPEIAVLEVVQAAQASLNVAADLGPIDRAVAGLENRQEELGIYLYMAGAELTGRGYRMYPLDSAMANGRRQLWTRPAVPRPTVDAITERLQKLPGWFALGMERAAGNRRGAEQAAGRILTAQPQSPDQEAKLWAEAGNGLRVLALENTIVTPNSDVFIDAAEAMRDYDVDAREIMLVLRRAAALGLADSPGYASPLTQSVFRNAVGMARTLDGAATAAALLDSAKQQVGSLPESKRPLAVVMIATCALDNGDASRSARLVDGIVSLTGPATRARLAVLLYRLRQEEQFEDLLKGMSPGVRTEVWTALLRETDVEPTDLLIARSLEGLDFFQRSVELVEVGFRRLQTGQKDRVSEIVREIVALQREMLENTSNNMGDGELLAAAGRIAWEAGDRKGAELVLRTMIEAAFESGPLAPRQLAEVASYWNRRMPEAEPR